MITDSLDIYAVKALPIEMKVHHREVPECGCVYHLCSQLRSGIQQLHKSLVLLFPSPLVMATQRTRASA
ncbi:hypothetical protein DPMN_022534 [Dreissena polymorpha]|uniref:Uncharacterized protein n=1 Tax=Dreissena polymorpha TaxID=45954 RepID=A0A9D4SCH2_DREPO|nr:hypothetical protein DPMN_022534 [Dreissena polymorpha]